MKIHRQIDAPVYTPAIANKHGMFGYTLWSARISAPPAFHIVDIACANLYGTENTVVADEQGTAQISLELFYRQSAATLSLLASRASSHSPKCFGGSTVSSAGLRINSATS